MIDADILNNNPAALGRSIFQKMAKFGGLKRYRQVRHCRETIMRILVGEAPSAVCTKPGGHIDRDDSRSSTAMAELNIKAIYHVVHIPEQLPKIGKSTRKANAKQRVYKQIADPSIALHIVA